MKLIARVAALIVLAIATWYAIDRWTIAPLQCAADASSGGNELDLAAREGDYAARRIARRVHDTLRDCECVTPPDGHVSFTLAEASNAMDAHEAAIAEYKRALDGERRPEIYFNLGMESLDALDRNAAIENLTRACAFDPSRINDIQYEDVRKEVVNRIRATYGAGWLR